MQTTGLFDFYSTFNLEYVVRIYIKAFHPLRLPDTEERFLTIGYASLLCVKIPGFILPLEMGDGGTELLLGFFYPLASFALALFQFHKDDSVLIKQAAITAIIHYSTRSAQFDTVVNGYKVHFDLIIVVHRRNPVLPLLFRNVGFFGGRSRTVTYTEFSFA